VKKLKGGGGWQAIRYTLRKARKSGGLLKFWRAMRSPNACKTCALGMGGADGGMTNELGRRLELCKKSVQAMAADMQGAIPDEFFEQFSVGEMRAMSSRELELAGRLTKPLLLEKGATHYRSIAWDEALKRCASKLAKTNPDNSFFYFSGRSSNEAGFLLQLFARVYGTNNVNNCSYYCHQASGVGLVESFGSGTATIKLDDLSKCDTLFLFGANPASNHPRFMKELLELRRRGGAVVVINPVREIGLCNFRVPSDWRSMLFGSEIASHYVQPKVGGDLAFITGIAKHLTEQQQIDSAFIEAATEDWEAWRTELEAASWESIIQESGVELEQIKTIAALYAKSKASIFAWAMGITHHLNGVDTVRGISNLAMMRGMVGRQGTGMLPLRGHSNVQGMGSMGVIPQLKTIVLDKLEELLACKLPRSKGLDTMACMEKADDDEVEVAWCLGGNLYASNPASEFAARAMRKINQVVYLNTSLNTGHAWGTGEETIILPVNARDEESQTTTQESMFSYVRRSAGGRPRHGKLRNETAIIIEVAKQLFATDSPVQWDSFNDADNIRELISKAIPGFTAIAKPTEFYIPGRAMHAPKFPTVSGRAQFAAVSFPKSETPKGQLNLMSVRSEGQFNTVVFEEEDVYRNQERRDVILLNPETMRELGLRHNQLVVVKSAVAEMKNILVREYHISRDGALMYYPECNVLFSTACDPKSKTPAYKKLAVSLVAL